MFVLSQRLCYLFFFFDLIALKTACNTNDVAIAEIVETFENAANPQTISGIWLLDGT